MTKNLNLLSFFRTRLFFTYFLISILTISCSVKLPTSSIYSTDANTNEQIKWPEIIDEDDYTRVRLTPLENVDQMLLFEVEVTNKNQDSLYVNPQDWTLDYLSIKNDKNLSPVDSTSHPLSGSEINDSYQKIAKRIVNARNGTTALVIAGLVVIIVVIVAIIASESDNKEKDKDKKARKNTADLGFFAAMNINYSSFKAPETDEWSNKQRIAYFRKRGELLQHADFGPSTLLKGETRVFGLYFPRKGSSSNLMLNGVVGDEHYNWDFKHYVEDLVKIN